MLIRGSGPAGTPSRSSCEGCLDPCSCVTEASLRQGLAGSRGWLSKCDLGQAEAASAGRGRQCHFPGPVGDRGPSRGLMLAQV